MKRRISIVFGAFFILLCVFGLLRYHAAGWLVFLVIGVYLLLPQKFKQPVTPSAPVSNDSPDNCDKGFLFPIVGVTFCNEDGEERQQILRKIYFKDTPFDVAQNVTLERYLWKEKPAYYVKVNNIVVGNIGADFVWYFEKNSNRPYRIDYIKVYGGEDNKNYGAEIHGTYLDVE